MNDIHIDTLMMLQILYKTSQFVILINKIKFSKIDERRRLERVDSYDD